MNVLDIVSERPLDEKPDDARSCPKCGGKELIRGGAHTTLLGWTGPVNPNHRWHEYTCPQCNLDFTCEIQGNNVWYTTKVDKQAVILKGIPSCFEYYLYHCSKCGGPVSKEHRALSGSPTTTLSARRVDDKWVKDYKTFYICQACGNGGETEEEYFSPRSSAG